MLSLPKKIIYILRYFEEVFDERVWEWAKIQMTRSDLDSWRTHSSSSITSDGIAR
jgi:hypothetical protein